MGLLTLLAGAVIGGLLMNSGSSESKSQKASNNTGVRVTYHYAQPKESNQSNNYKRYNDTPKRESIYDKKTEFFDKYREIDNYLASLIGQNYKGITYFISGAIEISKRSYEDADFVEKLRIMIKKLKDIRAYRNMLSHDKSKWQSLADPNSEYLDYLRRVGCMIPRAIELYSDIVEEGYYYIKNQNNY